MPGLRNVTKDKTVFYFTVHEDLEEVRVLAIFFGGQDHIRKMLMRLG
jgi:plasmid stabilization system protein ParE